MRLSSILFGTVAALGALTAAAGGCAKGTRAAELEASATGSGGGTASGSGSAGGMAGGIGGSGGGVSLPCGIDCSTIKTADTCHVAQCNMTSHMCEVVQRMDGQPCDDGQFCTTEDACTGGVCMGGPPNSCGQGEPPPCHQINCDEPSHSCSLIAGQDGTSCVPADKCQINGACQGGNCIGSPNTCEFVMPPDACHLMQCDPSDGTCKPQPGNDGAPCLDPNDLCTAGKTCKTGACQGGMPKDCSALTKGCVSGVCDKNNGQCTTQPLKDGDSCKSGIACKAMETCAGGVCQGGVTISQCIDNDGCCPPSCNEQNDNDCGCAVNLALSATPSSNGGGVDQFGYGPKKLNDGVTQKGCMMAGCNQCFCWVSNTTNAGGAYVEYDWAAPQTIGSMFVDAQPCAGTCGGDGRTVFSGKVQWWDGASWQLAQSFTNNDGPLSMSFNPKLTTEKLRIFDIATGKCGQMSNTLIYEWGVWQGSNCSL